VLPQVGHVFSNFNLDRAMADTYHHAKRVFNMSDTSNCDPKCIHSCHCSYAAIPIHWEPPNMTAPPVPHVDVQAPVPWPKRTEEPDKWTTSMPVPYLLCACVYVSRFHLQSVLQHDIQDCCDRCVRLCAFARPCALVRI
jgi:hypothetical protein